MSVEELKLLNINLSSFELPINLSLDLNTKTLSSYKHLKCGLNLQSKALKAKDLNSLTRKLKLLLPECFKHCYNALTSRQAVFINALNPIPLFGTRYFGIIDRGTNILELRPNTGCNLSCVFCSVGEGFNVKKTDFIVEAYYLKKWVDYALSFKKQSVELFINPQGEPLLYQELELLVKLLKQNKKVGKVSIVTNGLLLPSNFKRLIKAGVSSFHVSFPGFTNVKPLVGLNYDSNAVANALKQIVLQEKPLELWLTPVWVKGLNDLQVKEVVKLGLELKRLINENNAKAKVFIAIQNYLQYRAGRKVKGFKQLPWKLFYKNLEQLESEFKEFKLNLTLTPSDVGIKPDNFVEKPLRTGQVVKAKIVCNGRNKNEFIAVTPANSAEPFQSIDFKARSIVVSSNKQSLGKLIGKTVLVKITHSKHNLFHAVLA